MHAKLSVIIPVYNCQDLLPTAIESVLCQPINREDISIYLIDDGSCDQSLSVCKQYAEHYDNIQCIHQENAGVSKARNTGIEMALHNSADGFLAFLDADDFWVKNCIDYELLDKYSSYDLIGMSSYRSNYQGNRVAPFMQPYKSRVINCDIGTISWIYQGTTLSHLINITLVRRYNLRFIENLWSNEDVIFLRECIFCAKRMAFFSQYFYIYRSNPRSVTHVAIDDENTVIQIAMGWYKAMNAFDNIEEIPVEKREVWKESCRELVGARMLEAARRLAENGMDENAIRHIIENNELSSLFNRLTGDELAEWQKADLLQYRGNIRRFIWNCSKHGMRRRLLQAVYNIKPVNAVMQKLRYPYRLKELN